ncbi:hypothetical protein MSAN_00798200 [Mycena sanguinolenta]|uniref:Uncharacterized protein n=1 Tax=Mycena sanguinolenta TaxID=230812 RepID=A0A8H6YVU5_9AGAR|nr:hypothetical protein MSAN_00798200 [Mycena sanguinolenta]
MGALMGGGVGLTIGFLFGSWSILQHGAGPRGVLSTLSKTMLSSAATFSFFLAIGSVSFSLFDELRLMRRQVIRNDSLEGAHPQMMVPVPVMRSRAEGFQLMRARWEGGASSCIVNSIIGLQASKPTVKPIIHPMYFCGVLRVRYPI